MDKLIHCNRLLRCVGYLSLQSNRHFHLACPVLKQTHYEVLGISKDATSQEIKDAFVKRSKEIHPDLNQDDPDTHEKFVVVNEAYSVLSKLKTRREYDEMLEQPQKARYTSGTYYHGSGMPYDDFYSDTFYDPSKAKGDGKHNYYGIKGMKKKTNAEIATLAIVCLTAGAVVYLTTGIWTYKLRKKHEDEVYKENQRVYDEIRANAGKFKTPDQLEQFILKHQEMLSSGSSK